MNPKLAIQLVVWNSAAYIPYWFKSLREQTWRDFELIIVDNCSTDNTVELIKKELLQLPLPHKLILNSENSGFTGGHNRAFGESDSEYVVFMNPDLYLAPDCLGQLVNFLERNQQVAGVTPRLMRWNYSQISENIRSSFTNTIDSLGLKIFRNRRVVEIGAGEEWGEGSAKAREVFGFSGTCAMFRRSALKTVILPHHEIFDASYHSYKEDFDLALRLRSAGFSLYMLPSAVAYHDRTAAGARGLSDRSAAKNKTTQSFYIQYHSYKNHLATLYKNEYWPSLLLDWPWILWYELKKFAYFLLFKPKILAGIGELWGQKARLKELRIRNNELRKVNWRDMRKWWAIH